MTYSELVIDPDIMRDTSAGFLSPEDDDNELKALYYTPSKNQLKLDVCGVLNLRPESTSDMSVLDTLTTDYQTAFKQMLMYLQLFYYFQNQDGGEGTKTNALMKHFLKLYNEKLKESQNFKINSYTQASMKRLLRG